MFQLFRHSGMDRRNPDCRDAHKPRRPWSLDSGDQCRNDGCVNNIDPISQPFPAGLEGERLHICRGGLNKKKLKNQIFSYIHAAINLPKYDPP